jgi:hypothetical protein
VHGDYNRFLKNIFFILIDLGKESGDRMSIWKKQNTAIMKEATKEHVDAIWNDLQADARWKNIALDMVNGLVQEMR